MRDARDDWRRYDPASIPGKGATPQLDAFLAGILERRPERPPWLLDVGCGTGRLARRLFAAGFSVVGVDINAEAVRVARAMAADVEPTGESLRFEVADFAAMEHPRVAGGPFDVVVCQLVLSIVGDAGDRVNLLRHLRASLRPGGWLYLSASGVSDSINPAYARLYAADYPLTGERHSYLSRDDRGEVLYRTHHFTADEVVDLLATTGFGDIRVTTVEEASSRRPSEAAFFHYATCRGG